jgi:hypothetical protein
MKRTCVASEMKAIADQCKTLSTFLLDIVIRQAGFVKYYRPDYEVI